MFSASAEFGGWDLLLNKSPCSTGQGDLLLKGETSMEPQYAGLAHDFPSRIVCLSYDTFNILCELGCAEKIIGKPVGAGKNRSSTEYIQNIGSFGSPIFEAIVALKPDIVIGYSEITAGIMAQLITQEINVLDLQHASLEEIYRSIIILGRICNKNREAAALINAMRQGFKEISSGIPQRRPKPVVYFEEWDEPHVCSIKWISEIISIAGGIDAFAHRCISQKAMERIVTSSEVIALGPDIIIASWCGKPVDIDAIKQRPGWDAIPAVSQNRIYEVPGEIILQPGPALIEGARCFSKIINQNAEKV